jgi:hypothetical protein
VLTDFTADVASESGRKLPLDGTVHETTTTALSFVSHVFEYAEVRMCCLAGQPVSLRKKGEALFVQEKRSICCLCHCRILSLSALIAAVADSKVVGNVLLSKRDGILNLERTKESTQATARWIASGQLLALFLHFP